MMFFLVGCAVNTGIFTYRYRAMTEGSIYDSLVVLISMYWFSSHAAYALSVMSMITAFFHESLARGSPEEFRSVTAFTFPINQVSTRRPSYLIWLLETKNVLGRIRTFTLSDLGLSQARLPLRHKDNTKRGRRESNPHVSNYPFICLEGRGDTPAC